jgi:hypothetical protein
MRPGIGGDVDERSRRARSGAGHRVDGRRSALAAEAAIGRDRRAPVDFKQLLPGLCR